MKKLNIIPVIILTTLIVWLGFGTYISFAETGDVTTASMSFIEKMNDGTGSNAVLTKFDIHERAIAEPGEDLMSTVIFRLIDFMKYGLAAIAIIYLVIAGLSIIMVGSDIETAWTKYKDSLQMIFFGLITAFVLDEILFTIYGENGIDNWQNEAIVKETAKDVYEIILGIFRALEIVVGAAAIFFISLAGFKLIVASVDETEVTNSKNSVLYSIVALILIASAEVLIEKIIFPEMGEEMPSITDGFEYIVMMTKFISSFISVIAVPAIIYGGYLYVTSFGSTDQTDKAKKVLLGTVIGLVISMGAYAIVNSIQSYIDAPKIESIIQQDGSVENDF